MKNKKNLLQLKKLRIVNLNAISGGNNGEIKKSRDGKICNDTADCPASQQACSGNDQ